MITRVEPPVSEDEVFELGHRALIGVPATPGHPNSARLHSVLGTDISRATEVRTGMDSWTASPIRARQAALLRKRVEDLLADAAAFRRACDIRAYVEEARAANVDAPEPLSAQDMDSWAKRTLALGRPDRPC